MTPLTVPSESTLILASGSQTRRQMLAHAGIPFTVMVSAVAEVPVRDHCWRTGTPTEAAAVALGGAKAREVALQRPESLVLGSDQLLELDGRWLAKPPSRAAATAQLTLLAGRRHRLVSGAVLLRGTTTVWAGWDAADLTMRCLTPAAIEQYLDLGGPEVLSSVGCYQIERLGVRLFERIEGDWFAILGLPLLKLLPVLRREGVMDPCL